MASEEAQEIYRTLREGDNKYTYFLLAAAGAAIALAINQTQNMGLAYSQIPLAIGVLCWAFSFFSGCRYIAYVNSTTYANYELLKVEKGEHPKTGKNPQLIAAASEGILKAINSNSEKAVRYGHWQFRFLIIGALFYIIWHIIEMYINNP